MLGINRSEHRTSSIGQPELTDLERRVNNLFRVGVIEEVDYRRAVARVALQDGELLTDWLPWLTMRAGADSVWWAPEPGEVALVGSLSGELHAGFILGMAFSNGQRPSSRPGVMRADFGDGTVIEYDRKAHRLDVRVEAGDVEDPEAAEAEESGAAEGPEPNDPDTTAGELNLEAAEDVLMKAGRDLAVRVIGNLRLEVDGESDTTIEVLGHADLRIATLGKVDIFGGSGVNLNPPGLDVGGLFS